MKRTELANLELCADVLGALFDELNRHALAKAFLIAAPSKAPRVANLHAAALAALRGERMHTMRCTARRCGLVSFHRDPVMFACPSCGWLEGSVHP